ncbi:MAG: hypothetical protein AABY22_00160 [Nanoarchaeota archaeon]
MNKEMLKIMDKIYLCFYIIDKAIQIYEYAEFETEVLKGMKATGKCEVFGPHGWHTKHLLKAKKVGNPMIYQCLKCGKILKSKKNKK